MGTPDVQIDHDATADFVSALRAQADALETSAPRYTAAVVAAAKADASLGSRDGAPIPLYAEAVTALERVMDKIERQALAIARKIRADADVLEAARAEIADADGDGADAVNKADVALGDVGDIGGSVSPKGGQDIAGSVVGEDPRSGNPQAKGGVPVAAFVDTAAVIAAVRGGTR
ncbi:hypothetical protein MYK68_00265 [Gordonia sp. PP30]|uniref:hypothetical protein n=1 Tax=Gordonia sp. PP30 TaxID=2935861 RepID=UPI001FFE5A3B|nr:hypothetical protein [Gordonia sp. PP30]UQE75121.1 hypothetical protein MYK68_00265 [Gordonia sp. PP30]